MADVTVAQLSPRLQKMATQVRTVSAQGNHAYVIELSEQILRESPGCIAVRRLHRQAQLNQGSSTRSWWQRAKGMMIQMKPIKAGGEFRQADSILSVDPWNETGLKILATAANKAEFPETALFAYEARFELAPSELNAGLKLAELYLARGLIPRALEVAERVVKIHPQNPAALALFRKVSIAQTVRSGNWAQDGNFRDKLRE